MIRIVLDTSTLISAIGWKESKPREIINQCLNNKFVILLSPDCINELKGVMQRKKFDFIDKDMKEELLLLLSEIAEIIIPRSKIGLCRDKKDNKFIELAVDGKADYIISGDDDLLSLKKVDNIRIINAGDFLNCLNSKSKDSF